MTGSWVIKRLGEVCAVKTGKKDVNEGNPNGKYPFFTCAREHTYSDEYSFDTEAILIAGNGDVGTVSYYSGKFEAYQRTYVLSNFNNIYPRFLYLILDGYLKNKVSKYKLGNTMPYIKMGMLTDFEIPLPPLTEQKRIVAVLDKAFAAISKAKENAAKNLQNARELFKSYVNNIFVNSGKDWELKTLGEVCDLIGGGTPSKANSKYYNGNIPWATVRDMNCDILEKTERSITEEAIKYCSTNIIPKENVIVATRVGLGKVCLLNQDTAINQDLRGVIPKQNSCISKQYLFQWFKSIAHIIAEEGTGATVKGVKLPFMQSLSIPVPPLCEQKRMVTKLDAFSEKINKLESIYRQKLADLEELKKSILRKAFNGELTGEKQ